MRVTSVTNVLSALSVAQRHIQRKEHNDRIERIAGNERIQPNDRIGRNEKNERIKPNESNKRIERIGLTGGFSLAST